MEKQGIAIYSGIVCEKVFVYEPYKPEEAACGSEYPKDVSVCLDEYLQALSKARSELDDIVRVVAEFAPEKAKIFETHQLLLEDVAIDQDIRDQISGGKYVFSAVSDVYTTYINILGRAENEFTNERVADLKDVRNRILRCAEGKPEKNLSMLKEPCVIIARELLPSDTATIDRKNVRAIVTELGGVTSHTAIVARSYGIPSVLGVDGILESVVDGEAVIVDGAAGLVIVQPDAGEIESYRLRQISEENRRQKIQHYRDAPAVTQDGTKIAIKLNISSVGMLGKEDIAACDGVGLMRTEFMYMQSKEGPPNEQVQFQEYKAAAVAFQGKPVILRTLDIGGDKHLPYLELPQEENPFLGKRALRLCLENDAIFRTQLRAALRASHYGELWIMFPMVGSLDDFRAAKAFVHTVMAELDAENTPYNKNIPLGIMIEIPSIAMISEHVAKEVDFASIGTNDLCQYLMAADRLNPSVAAYYQSYHPAVFRIIKEVAMQFSLNNKPLSICGELAGEPAAVVVFAGLGIRSLSMNATSIATVKQVICSMDIKEAQRISATICTLDTESKVRHILTEAAEL
jgi:phosphotransferase system enzyme I (PtsI)